MKKLLLYVLVFIVTSASAKNAMTHRIEVSDNRHFLQYADGRPFFYLGDTAWELFHWLNREEADYYLADRAAKGFTVIQAVAIAELDGIKTPNANGHLPFVDEDPTRPAIMEGEANDYWDHVDYIVQKANSLGLTVGLLPTWGRYWHDGNKPIFNKENARIYGQFLGQRYKDAGIIWILGGDRNADNKQYKATIRAMAAGLKEGDGGAHLITYHPGGAWGSADFFHKDEWLSFNMRENGHNEIYDVYAKTYVQYKYKPTKPIIDSEPLYEDHPVAFDPDHRGHSVAADVRRPLYWDLFEGACGHTYGHHSVWQMFDPSKGRSPINHPLMPWREALQQPGARQMQYGKNLMLSRPYFTRIPATGEALVSSNITSEIPGTGVYHFAATRDTDGTYIMVYAPVGRSFTVITSLLSGQKLNLWWFDPRTGKAKKAGSRKNTGKLTISSPAGGEIQDWILVIDNADAGYNTPGKPIY